MKKRQAKKLLAVLDRIDEKLDRIAIAGVCLDDAIGDLNESLQQYLAPEEPASDADTNEDGDDAHGTGEV